MLRLVAMIALALLAASCRPRSDSELKGGFVEDTSNNLPPSGRSIFDYLTTTEVDGQAVQKVPTPLSELAKRILVVADGKEVPHAVLPLDRSLQRLEASPKFLEFPRIVFGGLSVRLPGATPELSGQTVAPAFFGYLEATDSMEVISWNPAARRYEFQIVKNYSNPDKQVVIYAERSLCLSCHQDATPIFSQFPWSETQNSAKLAHFMEQAMGGRHEVLGFSFMPDTNDHGLLSRPVQALDSQAGLAYNYYRFQSLYRQVCSASTSPNACRTAILKAIFASRLQSFFNSNFTTSHDLDSLIDGFRTEDYSTFQMRNNLSAIPNRDLGLNTLPDDSSIITVNDHFLKESEQLPAKLNPLTPQLQRLALGQNPFSNIPYTLDQISTLIQNMGFALFQNDLADAFNSALMVPMGEAFSFDGNLNLSADGTGRLKKKGPGFNFLLIAQASLRSFAGGDGIEASCKKGASGLFCQFPDSALDPENIPPNGTSGKKIAIKNMRLHIESINSRAPKPELSTLDLEPEGEPARHLESRCFSKQVSDDPNQLLVTCDQIDFGKFWAASQALGRRVLNDDEFDPSEATQQILTALDAVPQLKPVHCCDWTRKFPEAKVGSISLPRALITDSRLQRAASHCYRCHHGSTGPMPFLRGDTEKDIVQFMKTNIALIRSEIVTGHMPPPTASEAQGLGPDPSEEKDKLLQDLADIAGADE